MKFIAQRIELAYDNGGIEAGKEKYRAYFVNTRIYARYREATDEMLLADGYEDCIVTD